MGDSNITRRDFLAKAVSLAAVPVLASAIASCGDGAGNTITSSSNNFDSELNSKETISIQSIGKANGKEKLAQLPVEAFYAPALEHGVYLTLCKTRIDGRACLQFIQVNVTDSSGSRKTVEGLPSNAVVYRNPEKVLADLIRIDRREIKRRFKRIDLFNGGSL